MLFIYWYIFEFTTVCRQIVLKNKIERENSIIIQVAQNYNSLVFKGPCV